MQTTPSLSKTAVLFIDVINDFKFNGGEKLLHHTKSILPHLKRLKAFACENNLPIIYINDHYGVWQADFQKIIKHCTNEYSQEIIKEIKPDDTDYFLIKPQHSAFFQDRKSTRLNSSHVAISYAVFCLKEKILNPDTAS